MIFRTEMLAEISTVTYVNRTVGKIILCFDRSGGVARVLEQCGTDEFSCSAQRQIYLEQVLAWPSYIMSCGCLLMCRIFVNAEKELALRILLPSENVCIFNSEISLQIEIFRDFYGLFLGMSAFAFVR
jgi:hypothetical protein